MDEQNKFHPGTGGAVLIERAQLQSGSARAQLRLGATGCSDLMPSLGTQVRGASSFPTSSSDQLGPLRDEKVTAESH